MARFKGPIMRQRGYNLVMLMIAITVLNIMVAVSLPTWSSLIQRDKEEELISRGWQYVEAIRVFQNRFQRLPVRLEELIEVKPRCIRRLWKDPMTDGGKFAVVHPDQPQVPDGLRPPPPDGQGGNGNNDPNAPDEGQDGREGTDPGSFGGPAKGEEVSVGPIIGVRSRSNKKSLLVFYGREHYNEWRFTLDLMLGGGRQVPPPPGTGGGQQPPPQGAGLSLSTRWLGRPLPTFFQPQPGTMPDGEPPPNGLPGGNPGRNPGRNPGTPGGGKQQPPGGSLPRPEGGG